MRIKLDRFVLECPDAHAPAEFCSNLFGWRIRSDQPDWVSLGEPV